MKKKDADDMIERIQKTDPEFVKRWIKEYFEKHPEMNSPCNTGRCRKKKRWIRKTQFSGNHRYCDGCARQEPNFGKSDPSYFFWEEIEW